MTDKPKTGTGTPVAAATAAAETVVIIRDFQLGQVIRVIFITPDQAKQLPAIPDNALQIAIAPAGGL